MSNQEKEFTFPKVDPQGLEPDQFRHYLTGAIEDYYGILAKIPPEQMEKIPWKIWRVHENGTRQETLFFLFYGRCWWSTPMDEAVLWLPRLSAFFTYIWNQGEFRTSFQSSRELTRKDWEQHILIEYLHDPLCKVLNEAALEEAVDRGEVSCWRFPEEFQSKLVNELVIRYCENAYRFIARCPLFSVSGEVGSCYNLGPNLNLKIYDQREALIQDSRNSYQFPLWSGIDRFSSFHKNTAVLEIICPIKTENLEHTKFSGPTSIGGIDTEKCIKEQLSDLLDIVKWAFSTVYPNNGPLREGVITYYDDVLGISLPFHVSTFKRQAERSGTPYNLALDNIKHVTEWIAKALFYRERSLDMQCVFWHWGRSCLANLERDKLMESVIGLESLLVPNPGESRYRFGLHGAALLTKRPEESEEMAKTLRSIYSKRSTIVHGNRTDELHYANKALKLLGNSIESIINLFEVNILKPENPLAKQIEGLVLRNSPLTHLIKK